MAGTTLVLLCGACGHRSGCGNSHVWICIWRRMGMTLNELREKIDRIDSRNKGIIFAENVRG